MKNFTLEVTTPPVVNDDWSALVRILDIVPGSALMEDPDRPTILLDVDADSHRKAFMFVLGLAELVGLEVDQMEVIESRSSTVPQFIPDVECVDEWVQNSPKRPAIAY